MARPNIDNGGCPARKRLGPVCIAIAALAAALPAMALELTSPLSCQIGSDCFVLHHVDRDPGPGSMDFRCGPLTYDGHQGVDIALPTLQAMEAGVDVLTAAPGVVAAVRDEMADIALEEASSLAAAGRECGNGALVVHESGWTTQYCHLKRGSITVSAGTKVEAGQRLGSVGLSGNTDFPHLHVTLRRNGEIMDPFDARPIGTPCDPAASGRSLWAAESGIAYSEGAALSAGILDRMPEYAEVNATAPDATAPDATTLPASASVIVHWAHFFGLRRGDVIESRLTGPGGAILAEETYAMPKARIRQFRAIGRGKPDGGWPAGTYQGVSRLIRDDRTVDQIEANVRVAPQ